MWPKKIEKELFLNIHKIENLIWFGLVWFGLVTLIFYLMAYQSSRVIRYESHLCRIVAMVLTNYWGYKEVHAFPFP